MKRLIACLALLAALAVTASAGAATERADAPWVWTPGACKSTLIHTGVQTADGRVFNVAQAYCVGWGGPATCTWSKDYSYRYYTIFTAVTRSYDNVVRIFTLHTNGKNGFRGENGRAVARIGAAQFGSKVASLTWQMAEAQHEKGCGAP